MLFIKKENVPKVIMFKGKVIILSIGFMITNMTDKAAPPMM